MALVAADAEFSRNACEGARENAKKHGFKIVYDKTYPPATTDFTPIVRAMQAANPDLVVVCSYPLDSVGMVQGGQRDRLQAEDDRRRHGRPAGHRVQEPARAAAQRLGQLRDLGAVEEDDVRRHRRSSSRSTRRAPAAEGVDPLGYYLGGWGYAYIQVLGDAIKGAKSLEDDKLADYMRKTTFKTIMGDIKFGTNGEWEKGRMLQVQYHGIKQGAGLDVWRGMSLPDRADAGRSEDRQRDLSVREGEAVSNADAIKNKAPRGRIPRGVFFWRRRKA